MLPVRNSGMALWPPFVVAVVARSCESNPPAFAVPASPAIFAAAWRSIRVLPSVVKPLAELSCGYWSGLMPFRCKMSACVSPTLPTSSLPLTSTAGLKFDFVAVGFVGSTGGIPLTGCRALMASISAITSCGGASPARTALVARSTSCW